MPEIIKPEPRQIQTALLLQITEDIGEEIRTKRRTGTRDEQEAAIRKRSLPGDVLPELLQNFRRQDQRPVRARRFQVRLGSVWRKAAVEDQAIRQKILLLETAQLAGPNTGR